LPYIQKLPTVEKPNPPDLTYAQIEANKVARSNHDAAIQKYWNNFFAFLLTWMIKTYLPLETYAVALNEQWTNLSATGGIQSIIAQIDTVESKFLVLANLKNSNIKNYEPVLIARGGQEMEADKSHTLIITDLTEKDKVLKLARMVHKIHPDVAENILAGNFSLYSEAKLYAMTACDHRHLLRRGRNPAPNRNPRNTTYANALTDSMSPYIAN